MTSPALEDRPEEKLDPAMERVQRKLRRLLAVSGLIMVAGLIAVFAAIFYRLSVMDKAMPQAPAETSVTLPAGSEVRSASSTGERLTLLVDAPDGASKVVIVDLATGRTVSTVTLTADGE
ncbi:DUF6476 family protein [Amorphus coralli]|uniref:DUF6476 family protein n=1 Tax=Amorphus coralli TaxID=340680 RepID=UPI000364DE8A|nr:DUF6476 family protein [Amorphus coralli]